MAGNMDERIIQMRFENRQFEKNIAKSKKSLEDFKKEMDFEDTSRNMEEFARATNRLSFDGLFSNIQKLTDRFTGLGDAGDYVLRRIRAGIEGVAMQVESFVKSISLAQVGVGQNKYNALTRSVQTIVAGGSATEKEAYNVMERVMEYTNQTSHSFETLVGQISALTSTGTQLEKAERLMEGFANASTKAGADASKAAVAMQVYAKAMGSFLTKNEFDTLNLTARVVTKEWREEMIAAGIAAGDLEKNTKGVIKTAKKYGKQIEVTADTLENTLMKKWASKETMSIFGERYMFGETIEDLRHPEKAMESFGKTAYLTGQRALTFADAINAIKESVSSGWMESFRIIFGDLSDAMTFFTDVCNRVIESLEKLSAWRNDFLRSWRLSGGRDSLIEIILGEYSEGARSGAYGLLDVLDGIGKIIYQGIADFFGLFADPDDRHMFKNDPEYFASWLGIQTAKITQSVQDFMQSIRDWFTEPIEFGGKTTSRLEMIHGIVEGIVSALALGVQVIAGLYVFITKIGEQLMPSINNILGMFSLLGTTLYGDVWDASREDVIVQFFENLAETFKPLTDGINELVGAFVELVSVLVESDQSNGTSKSIFSYIGDALKFLAGIITSVGVPVLNFIKNLILMIKELFSGGKNVSGQSQSKGLLDSIGDLISGIVSAFNENGFENLHNRLTKIASWFKTINIGSLIQIILGGVTIGGIIALVSRLNYAFKRIGMFFEDPGGALKQGLLGNYEFFSERLLNIAKGIALIAASVVVLGSMNTRALVQGVLAVGAVMAGLALFTQMMSGIKAGFLKQMAATAQIMALAAAIAGMAISVGILILALKPFSGMDWDQIVKMMTGLGIVLFELIATMEIIKSYGITTASLGGFIGFALSIGILIMAIRPFANMDWDKIVKATVGLGIVIAELLATMMIVEANGIQSVKLGGFIAFALSIAILVAAIQPFANMDWDEIVKATVGLGIVILELLAAAEIMSAVPTSGLLKASVAFLAIGLVMGTFASALNKVKDMRWETIIVFASGFSMIIMALAAALAITSKVGNLKGVVILAAGLAALMGVIGLLGSWLMGSIGNGLADMSSKLAIMADMMNIFSSRMANVDESGVDKAKNMIESLKNLMGNIGTFGSISVSASAFSTAMFNLGTGLRMFSDNTRGANASTGNAALMLIKELAGCASDLDTIARMNISNLTANISGLGGAMMLYAAGAKEATGVETVGDGSDVTAAVDIMERISEALTENGGFTIPTDMPSEEELGNFGAQLAALAGALVLFENAGAGLGEGTDKALETLTFFEQLKLKLAEIDFANSIPYVTEFNDLLSSEGGFGPTELETFGANIQQLGYALQSFSESTTVIDEATGNIESVTFDAALDALTQFSILADSLPEVGGIRSWWRGNRQSLRDLGSDIQQLGSGLMTFSNKITGQGTEGKAGIKFDATAATAAITALDEMINFIDNANTKLPRLGGISKFFETLFIGHEYSFKDLGDQVGEMGEGLGRLGEGLSKGNWSQNTGVNYALDALNSIMDLLIKFAELYNQGVVASGAYAAEQIAAFINSFTFDTQGIQDMLNMMAQISQEFNDYSKDGGIDPSRIEAFKHMAEALSSLASINPEYDWSVVGMSIDTGIASGLTAGTSIVTSAAQGVALAAYNAAMSALQAHSPSRLFMNVGGFISQGMAIGIEDSASDVTDAMASISTALAESVNSQPTITPVLDMSNVTSGMKDFGRNLNGRSITLDTSLSAAIAGRYAGDSGSSSNQNRSNYEALSQQMNRMNAQLGELGAKIMNMRIVLDTGVVAGGVTDDVDVNLGRKQFYAQRRN